MVSIRTSLGQHAKYLKMKRDQGECKSLQVLHKIVKHSESFWVGGLGHVDQGTDFRGLYITGG